jgi:hypothetical protein
MTAARHHTVVLRGVPGAVTTGREGAVAAPAFASTLAGLPHAATGAAAAVVARGMMRPMQECAYPPRITTVKWGTRAAAATTAAAATAVAPPPPTAAASGQ